RQDVELLAELLEHRLQDLEPVDERVREEQGLLPAAMLVVGEGGAVPGGGGRAMELVADPAPVGLLWRDRARRLVAVIGAVEVAAEARDIAQQLERLHSLGGRVGAPRGRLGGLPA